MVAKIRVVGRHQRQQEPLEVRVSLRFTFGDELGDSVQMIDDRRVPLVGSVFENRALILHSFTLLMLRAGIMQSKVIAEIIPAFRLLSRHSSAGRRLNRSAVGQLS